MQNLTFTLTVAETNVIMQALGNMPYAQVRDLVDKLREQAAPQLNGNGTSAQDEESK